MEINEHEARELISRLKRDADFDMGDDSMIAAKTIEALLEQRRALASAMQQILPELRGLALVSTEAKRLADIGAKALTTTQ